MQFRALKLTVYAFRINLGIRHFTLHGLIFMSKLMKPRKYSFEQHSSKAFSVQFLLKPMLYFIHTIEYKRERLDCITP